MTTIKDIYQWYTNGIYKLPKHPMPEDLTPFKRIEWSEQNQNLIEDYENFCKNHRSKTFVGNYLSNNLAFVSSVHKTYILANAFFEYQVDSAIIDGHQNPYPYPSFITDRDNDYKIEKPIEDLSNHPQNFKLRVRYIIEFDTDFYEIIRSLNENSKIEFNGQILNFEEKTYKISYTFINTTNEWDSGMYNPYTRDQPVREVRTSKNEIMSCILYVIGIKLSSIKVIDKYRISSDLIESDEDLREREKLAEQIRNKIEAERLKSEKEGFEKERIKEIKRREEDNKNLSKSVGRGILWAFIGLPIGLICGGIIGFVFSMIYIILANESPQAGDKVMNKTMWIVIVICVIIGFFSGFISTREKK